MSPPALIHRAATAGTAHNVLGMTHVYKAGPEETGGAFLLFELLVPPGCAAPLHRHENDTECFFVLDGALTFMSPGGARIAGVGETCLLPAGGAHAFRNDGERPARALVVASPGRD
ncbi:MAG: cupin domain-containing protein, partial [Alphaproteobacteria bacterium]|nr:cupin domain-containing protein [Alphaproteobacteria bacterium]